MSEAANHSQLLVRAIDLTAALILFGLVCAFVRLVKGPSLPDRVVSVDLITVLAVAIVGLVQVETGSESYVDVAFALALVAFLATVAFAWYADQRTNETANGRVRDDREGES